jgi:hypothetical protein
MMKKRDPASPWPMFRSFSTAGIKGARMILERKFNRKIPARKRRGVIRERKGEGSLSTFPD